MRKLMLLAALALAVSAGGCAQLTNAWNAITGAKVSPQAVIVAANSFDALEATATNYIRLKRCTASGGPVCSDDEVVAQLVPAIRSGRVARNNLEQFLHDHPGALGPSGLYDALTASIDTLRSIIATYNIGASK